MTTSRQLLFVYGSLRSGFQHDAYQYMAQYFTLLGNATVKGKLYDKGEYPVAIPATDDKFITGELYVINSEADFSYPIGQLDDYEGVIAEEGQTPLYKRETTAIYYNNTVVNAWIYWYNGSVQSLPQVASGDILQYLKEKNKA
jgi:gamma-glutamylcyclotransferase (GGCT)/AIG2-like uncharacterized protein YtfP